MAAYTKQELIESIKRFYDETGRVPKSYEFDNNSSYPSRRTFTKHFGSWNNALRACEFDVNQKKMRCSDDELLKYISEFFDNCGRYPTMTDFENDEQYPHPSTYANHFGSWTNALTKVGGKRSYKKYTDEELINFLIDFHEKYNRIPTTKDFNNYPTYPDSTTYRKRFGSWPNVVKQAGFVPGRNTPSKYETDEDRIIGYKKTNLKSIHKRKRSMGFNPINKYFENCHAHHLHIKNHDDILYIPRELHMAIGHDHHKNQNIFEMNLHSLNWYLHNYNDAEEFKNVMNAFNLNVGDTDTDLNDIINSFEPGVNDELRQELILLNNEMSAYTDDQLIHSIQLYHNTHGKIPEFSDFQNHEINPLIYIYSYTSWVSALRLMEFDVTELLDKNKIYAKAELIQYLKMLAEELGRAPQIRDMDNKPNYPTAAPYRSMFGSWNNALIECGFDVNYQTYTKSELISYMKAFYEENGQPPMIKDFENNPSYPGRGTYTRAFGSWNNALIECGFKVHHVNYTPNELIEFIHKYYEEYGKVPNYDDFLNNSKYPSPHPYAKHFGSWNNGIKEAGYAPYERVQKYTDDELLEYIHKFYHENQRIPKYSDFSNNPEYPSANTYSIRFGSFNKALLGCGFEEYHPMITEEELITHIHRYYEEYGKVPKYDDFRNNPDYPSPSTYENHFGSWSNGIKKAGYKPYKHMHINTNDELIEYIHKFYVKNQRLPTTRDFSKNPEYPSARTYSVRFGSWNQALEIYHKSKNN